MSRIFSNGQLFLESLPLLENYDGKSYGTNGVVPSEKTTDIAEDVSFDNIKSLCESMRKVILHIECSLDGVKDNPSELENYKHEIPEVEGILKKYKNAFSPFFLLVENKNYQAAVVQYAEILKDDFLVIYVKIWKLQELPGKQFKKSHQVGLARLAKDLESH